MEKCRLRSHDGWNKIDPRPHNHFQSLIKPHVPTTGSKTRTISPWSHYHWPFWLSTHQFWPKQVATVPLPTSKKEIHWTWPSAHQRAALFSKNYRMLFSPGPSINPNITISLSRSAVYIYISSFSCENQKKSSCFSAKLVSFSHSEMAILNQHFTPCSSSFLSPKPSPPFSSLPYPTPHSKTTLKSISSSSSTPTSSPFTESHSIQRYQRDSWLYNDPSPKISCSIPYDPSSARDDDIALQLPELKKLLQVLREKREKEGSFDGGSRGPGNVFLVGTGPGDPELLTLKALRAIESADLLLYDRLVSTDVLDLVRGDARLLYVGKTAGYHSRTQVWFALIFNFSSIFLVVRMHWILGFWLNWELGFSGFLIW